MVNDPPLLGEMEKKKTDARLARCLLLEAPHVLILRGWVWDGRNPGPNTREQQAVWAGKQARAGGTHRQDVLHALRFLHDGRHARPRRDIVQQLADLLRLHTQTVHHNTRVFNMPSKRSCVAQGQPGSQWHVKADCRGVGEPTAWSHPFQKKREGVKGTGWHCPPAVHKVRGACWNMEPSLCAAS